MELIKHNLKYNHLIDDYYLPDEQFYYSAMPLEAVEISKNNNDRHTLLGMDDGELVTFFILHENEECSFIPISRMIFYCGRFLLITNIRGKVMREKRSSCCLIL